MEENMENPEKVEKTVEKSDFQKRADAFFADLKELQDKHKTDINISIDFPEYKILPDELRLALSVMSKHKMQFVIGLKDREVQDGNKS